MSRIVHIVGSGFSGLSAAYYLQKAGYDAVVYEKEKVSGGLVKTEITPYGMVESGANAFLNSRSLEELAADIGLPLLVSNQAAKRRFIFRTSPKQWPLSILESLDLVFRVISSLLRGAFKPSLDNSESVQMWGNRVLGRPATKYLLAPALAGVYAGDIAKMDATLVLGSLFDRKRRSRMRPESFSGSVAPANGMGELLERLKKFLLDQSVEFKYESSFSLKSIRSGESVVIATSVTDAEAILTEFQPAYKRAFERLETISLVSVTCFFEKSESDLHGFGCLFVPSENMNFLGTLFNSDIFENRSDVFRSETWIGGGAKSEKLVDVSDKELLNRIREDRERLGMGWGEPKATYIHRWKKALPYFTGHLRVFIQHEIHEKLKEQNIYLHGNYMGRIGLSSILERAKLLPGKIAN